MSLTNFPNGITSFGIPVISAGISIPARNAPIIIVDPGGLAPRGTSGTFFDTVQEALNAVGTAGGATIFLFPGTYAENLVVTTPYLTIIGAQFAGYARPDIVGSGSGGIPLTVNAQGFRAIRCRFAGTAADAVVQHGNGFEYSDCVFDGDLTAAMAGLRLVGANVGGDITHFTASEGRVQDSLFRSNATGIILDTAAAPVGVGSSDNVISGNIFTRNTLDIATADTGAGTYSTQFVDIIANHFVDKNKATYLDFTTANGGAASDQSGVVNGNYFASDTMTTTKIKAVGTGFTFAGNYDTVGIFDGSGLD